MISSGKSSGYALLLCCFFVAGCEEGLQGLDFLQPTDTVEEPGTSPSAAGPGIEQDVEAPEIFAIETEGTWDGRPSLGGVWVAYPNIKDPERVLITNPSNGKSAVGALFRRERQSAGSELQVSSDAADALVMAAGANTVLKVVALRKEVIQPEPQPIAADGDTAENATTEVAAASVDAPENQEIETAALDPISTAAAAIARSEALAPSADGQTQSAAAPTTTAAAAPTRSTSKLEKPFIQIGIFSVEQNATNTATSLRSDGIIPSVLKQNSRGKTFWRVLVGPATTSTERADLLGKVKKLGFSDAYFVTN